MSYRRLTAKSRRNGPQTLGIVKICRPAPSFVSFACRAPGGWVMERRQFLTYGAAASAVLASGVARAESFAGKQIRLIVPFPAGGPTDIVARPFAQMFGDTLKATVIIDN